jgi:hypothetical protein
VSVMIVDRFTSGLDDLSGKQQGNEGAVLQVLDQCKRFSVFEATATDRIARTMDYVFKAGLVRDTGGSFPWTKVELTEEGRAKLDAYLKSKEAA